MPKELGFTLLSLYHQTKIRNTLLNYLPKFILSEQQKMKFALFGVVVFALLLSATAEDLTKKMSPSPIAVVAAAQVIPGQIIVQPPPVTPPKLQVQPPAGKT